MKEFKSRGENAFLFDVVFSKKKFEVELDFGLYCDPKRSKGPGSLAELYFKRNDPITRNKITEK
jgi:hypothetical protein